MGSEAARGALSLWEVADMSGRSWSKEAVEQEGWRIHPLVCARNIIENIGNDVRGLGYDSIEDLTPGGDQERSLLVDLIDRGLVQAEYQSDFGNYGRFYRINLTLRGVGCASSD